MKSKMLGMLAVAFAAVSLAVPQGNAQTGTYSNGQSSQPQNTVVAGGNSISLITLQNTAVAVTQTATFVNQQSYPFTLVVTARSAGVANATLTYGNGTAMNLQVLGGTDTDFIVARAVSTNPDIIAQEFSGTISGMVNSTSFSQSFSLLADGADPAQQNKAFTLTGFNSSAGYTISGQVELFSRSNSLMSPANLANQPSLNFGEYSNSVVVVPEPQSWALLMTGSVLLSVIYLIKRQRTQNS